jgi:NAD(P)-dependent dehydrogenase (short-subunit alcohol dehydrogenase family)
MALKNKPISDQVALVTGGGTGIGRAFTEALAAAGARVVIASRREDLLRHTAEELNLKLGAERVFPCVFDIRERRLIDALVGQVIKQHGTLDILINNSGLAVPETVDQITEEGWDKVMDTNLRGVMQLVRAALPFMIANEFGDIINVSSQAGKHGYADVPSYCASKFGLLGYAERCAIMCARPTLIFAFSISAPAWSMWKTAPPMPRQNPDSFTCRIWRAR